jgi:hypothetical protein
MANGGDQIMERRGSRWRLAGWGIAGLVLLLPLAAMQFTNEVRWDWKDFVFAGVLIGTVGAAFELTVRRTGNWAARAGVAAALAAAFLIIWANGAVGMIGDEDNPYNLLFVGVIAVALLGAVAARFRAAGMALAMGVAAILHAAVAVGGMFSDLRGGLFSAGFACVWLLSSALFRHAAREQSGEGGEVT